MKGDTIRRPRPTDRMPADWPHLRKEQRIKAKEAKKLPEIYLDLDAAGSDGRKRNRVKYVAGWDAIDWSDK